jgi:hypothetical protein
MLNFEAVSRELRSAQKWNRSENEEEEVQRGLTYAAMLPSYVTPSSVEPSPYMRIPDELIRHLPDYDTVPHCGACAG